MAQAKEELEREQEEQGVAIRRNSEMIEVLERNAIDLRCVLHVVHVLEARDTPCTVAQNARVCCRLQIQGWLVCARVCPAVVCGAHVCVRLAKPRAGTSSACGCASCSKRRGGVECGRVFQPRQVSNGCLQSVHSGPAPRCADHSNVPVPRLTAGIPWQRQRAQTHQSRCTARRSLWLSQHPNPSPRRRCPAGASSRRPSWQTMRWPSPRWMLAKAMVQHSLARR